MAIYVNLHAGVGKPLWEITLGEYSVWFQVRTQLDLSKERTLVAGTDTFRVSSDLCGCIQP